jgi:glycine oxidase
MTKEDAIVVGAGVFGLAAALALARRGRRVLVVERGRPGAGASGGLVGALAPYSPSPWSPKKAFQAEALRAAEAYWAGVAAASGADPGYRRIGRLAPLPGPEDRRRAEARAEAAATRWPGATWRLLEVDPFGVLSPEACACGLLHDDATARLDPRAALRALAGALAAAGGRVASAEAVAVEPGRLRLAGGGVLRAGTIVIAAGAASGPLLAPLGGPEVTGVKGQALLLEAAVPPGSPLIAANGLWIVPRSDRAVAVGSTSEAAWTTPGPDARADALLAQARTICPWLDGARTVERWAGIRPRAQGPDPVAGAVAPGIFVATGGYKIGFALAPPVADLLARMIEGEPAVPPPGVVSPQQDVW